MKIYTEEKSLEEMVATKCTARRIIPVSLIQQNSIDFKSFAKIDNKDIQKAFAKLEDHPDLMYGRAILVSTNWNDNDDVFMPKDTWAARKTPINTSFNDDHIEEDIIGHIIAAEAMDGRGGNLDQNAETPPDYFDIAVDFVVYSGIYPEIAKEILDKAPTGKKFVSMEAKFSEFDYGLIKDNKFSVIARNEETAFLTKHLRAYGGKGDYQNYKVGRILRNFRFSGMGNVDQPGNPRSEYTEIENMEVASLATSNLIQINKRVFFIESHIRKGHKMYEFTTVDEARRVVADLANKLERHESKEIDSLKDQLTALAKEKDKMSEEKDKAKKEKDDMMKEKDCAKKEKDDKDEELKAAKEKEKMASEAAKDWEKDKAKMKDDMDKMKADYKAKCDEWDSMQKKGKASKRIDELKGVGFKVDEAKAAEISEWSDTTYASVLEFAKTIKPSSQTVEEIAKAERKAKADLDKVTAGKNGAQVDTTTGDTSTDKYKDLVVKLGKALANRKNKTPVTK